MAEESSKFDNPERPNASNQETKDQRKKDSKPEKNSVDRKKKKGRTQDSPVDQEMAALLEEARHRNPVPVESLASPTIKEEIAASIQEIRDGKTDDVELAESNPTPVPETVPPPSNIPIRKPEDRYKDIGVLRHIYKNPKSLPGERILAANLLLGHYTKISSGSEKANQGLADRIKELADYIAQHNKRNAENPQTTQERQSLEFDNAVAQRQSRIKNEANATQEKTNEDETALAQEAKQWEQEEPAGEQETAILNRQDWHQKGTKQNLGEKKSPQEKPNENETLSEEEQLKLKIGTQWESQMRTALTARGLTPEQITREVETKKAAAIDQIYKKFKATQEVAPEPVTPETEPVRLSKDELKAVIKLLLGDRAKISALTLEGSGDRLRLNASLAGGPMIGRVNLSGEIINHNNGIDVFNPVIDARGYVRTAIQEKLKDVTGEIKKQFQGKYPKPVKSLSIENGELVLKF